MDDFTFSLARVSDAAAADLNRDYDSLRPNPYADGAWRWRRYSVFTFDRSSCTVALKPAHDFVQGEEINHFQGDVQRHYDDITEALWHSGGFAELFDAFARAADLPDVATIEVHQMRVISQAPDQPVETAPEGVHEDGFDRIAIVTVARENSSGAELSVHESREAAPFVTLRQGPGQYVVLNDRVLWHSATPLTAVEEGRPGYWDLLVLTANQA